MRKQSRHLNDIETKPASSVSTESQTLPLHTWSEEPVRSPIEEEKESPQSILYMVIGLLAAVAGVSSYMTFAAQWSLMFNPMYRWLSFYLFTLSMGGHQVMVLVR